MRWLISWFAENHVAANLLMVFILLAGIVSAITAKVEIFPETQADKVSITVHYPGASPSEVEEGVIKEIEEAISGVDGIKEINSFASEGNANIQVEVMKGWDVKTVADEIESAINRLTTLPEEAERPIVKQFVFKAPVLIVAVYGDQPLGVLKDVAERIKDEITSLPGITEASVYGVPEPEISIEVPEENLRKYNLTLTEIARRVRHASLDLPAGNVRSEEGYVLIRSKGKRYFARDYGDIVILSRDDGSSVRLSDIAILKDTFEERDLFARFQGKRSVSIWVYRVGEQNALDVAEKVKSYIQNIKSTLPHGVNVEVFGDRSEILRARLMLLLKNMAYGMILVIILLGLFLNYKLSFWITLGIPIAFATGLWLIPRYDVSINMISLFAFIMVLGIVVDDAIVIGENVFRRREAGEPPLSSAIEGTLEVGRPVIFSVLTTMAAFWPLLMGSGVMGKVIRQIPIVVILVLVGSLIEALLILPAHLARTRLPEKKSKKEAFVSNCLFSFIDGPYKKTLTLALQWRYATIAIGIFILLISLGLWFGGILKFTFFPEVQSDRMVAEVTMPVGTPPEVTDRITRYLEDKAIEAAEEIESKNNMNTNLIRYIFTIVGEQIPMGHRASTGPPPTGGNVGQVIVQLIGSEQRQDIPTNLVASVWRQKTGEIVGAESLVFYSELFSAGKAISFDLTMEDNESLLMAVDELKDQLRRFPGVYEVEDSYIPGKEELRINLKPSARALGLTLNDIARQVRAAFYGEEALRIQRGRDEIKVMVRYPSEERKRLLSLMNMRIITPDGNQVPLTEVATIKSSRGYVTITRRDQKRIITVSAEVDEAVATPTEIRNEIVKKIMPRLMEKYPGLRYEISGEGKEQSQSMADVFKGFLLALVLIYALLAVPLRSFTQPIVIMSAIPFGIIGAIVAHLILGINLSIMSLFGVVGLSGVVVNDSLILFDAINRLRRQGLEIEQAILKGTAMRFRAVILTTVTTFGGLLPMITEKSVQAQFLIPMALSLAGGVVFASVITLVLVPCGYRIMEDILTIKKRL